MGSDFEGAFRRIDAIILDPRSKARELVHRFFAEDSPFEGDLLHTLPGNEPYAITLQDLFAVTMVDVSVWPRGVRRFLFDQRHQMEISDHLREISICEDIWEGTTDFGPQGACWKLWTALQRYRGDGIAEVVAGKLMARKRPRLIPILDEVVVTTVQASPGSYWDMFRLYLQDDTRRQAVIALRPLGLDERVSTLRLADVAIWMRGSRGKAAKRVRTELGLPD